MTTLATMRTRIADELVNEEITDAQIDRAIVSAIQTYDDGNWWFNQETDSFSTVAAQETYTEAELEDLPNIVDMVSLKVSNGSSTTSLIAMTYSALVDTQDGTVTGIPTNYAIFAGRLWLYPIPDAAYTVTAYYAYKLPTLAQDADTNNWMTDGETLIRQTAKIILATDILQADDVANRFIPLADQALTKLRGENARRMPKKTLSMPLMPVSRSSFNINRGW